MCLNPKRSSASKAARRQGEQEFTKPRFPSKRRPEIAPSSLFFGISTQIRALFCLDAQYPLCFADLSISAKELFHEICLRNGVMNLRFRVLHLRIRDLLLQIRHLIGSHMGARCRPESAVFDLISVILKHRPRRSTNGRKSG